MRPSLLGFVVLLIALPGEAQDVPVGSCDKGTATGVLETETLRATVRNTGQLFYGRTEGGGSTWGAYIVPKESGAYPLNTLDLWVSGVIGDSLRTALGHHEPGDFWPGPLPDAEAPPADCSASDRIWTVSRDDVYRYLWTGEATPDLLSWPHHLGAPVIDGDGDPDNYDLNAGDQPDLIGDVAVWWVMNDTGNVHGSPMRSFYDWQRTASLGVEIRVHGFAFDEVPTPGIEAGPLRHATFFRYEIRNRRAVPVDSMYVSLVALGGTGGGGNDAVGTAPASHVAYLYNKYRGEYDYYKRMPASWGIQVIEGPVGLPNGYDDDHNGEVDEPGERIRLTSSPPMYVTTSRPWATPATDYPVEARARVNVQRGLWPDGTAIGAYDNGEYCAGGCTLGAPTVFAFPADPAVGRYWSEMNGTGDGWPTYRYRRWLDVIASTGPFRIEPGGSATITYAFPFARDYDHRYAATLVRGIAADFLAAFGDGFPSRPVEGPRTPLAPGVLSITPVSPNPSAGGGEAVLTLPASLPIEASIYDMLGRRVADVASGRFGAGNTTLRIPTLAAGSYVLRVEAIDGRSAVLPFAVAR